MHDPESADILVVGAGPTGSVLALLLAQQGLQVFAADKNPDIYPLPRAAHIDHETVRTFQALGLAEQMLESSRPVSRYDFLNKDGQVLLRFDETDAIGPGGWPIANMIHQPSIERLLRKRIKETPSIRLRTSWTLDRLVEKADHVEAHFCTPAGLSCVRAKYLVGADGAHSAVRALAGIAVDDLGFDEAWLVVDAIVHDRSRLPQVNLQICDPDRPSTCVPMGSGRHRWEFMMLPGETAEQVLDDGFIDRLLRPWDVAGAVTLERAAVYRFNARIAKQWRVGRVLLAGDAAHQMPPFAGQGLCSGLRDAANLSWKLGGILNHGASDRLLDFYQCEREPNVRGIIDVAIMMGRTVCTLDPAEAAARDAQMLAAHETDGRSDCGVSYPQVLTGCLLHGSPAAGSYFAQLRDGDNPSRRLDDVLGAGAWLIAKTFADLGSVEGSDVRAFALDGPELRPFRSALAKWLEAYSAAAVLVRPDRYVFGTGEPLELYDAHAYCCGLPPSSSSPTSLWGSWRSLE